MNDQCYLVAFDPGQTTGWCVMGVEKGILLGARHVNDKLYENLTIFKTGQIQCLGPQNGWNSISAAMENDGVASMLRLQNDYPQCAIIFEDFIIDFEQVTMTRSALSPVTVMAKFEMGFQFTLNLEGEAALGRIFRQNRSPVKTTCTDDRLKTWNLYDRNSGPHARDAVRHAYYFLRNCRGNSVKARELRWRAWPYLFNDPMLEDLKNNYYRNQEERSKIKDKKKGKRIESLG